MQLKAQDTLLALKLWSLNSSGEVFAMRDLAELIAISVGEVSKGVRRLRLSRLVVERDGVFYVEKGALLEWVSFGVRYAYPQENVGYGRGIATAWNCPLIQSDIVPPQPPLVWPASGGDSEGVLIQAIHPSVPFAISRDKNLYQAFALLEVIRGGKPRELAIARDLLRELIKGT